MKFGVNIINFGPGADPGSLRGWLSFAEELGYHLVMISDHVAITPDIQEGFPAPFYDPFTSLSWLAAMSDGVELGTTVTILPYRHPLLTARMGATIDQLSNGRFILGAGVGWARQEFDALGVPFDKRGALASEYLEAIKLCWANDVATYEGQHISFRDVHTAPRPVRSTGIPIWVGGSSEAALLRAVRYGDAWHPYRYTLEWLKNNALPGLSRIAALEGKPVPAFCPRLGIHLTDSPLAKEGRKVGHGSIDQVHADLKALDSLGASTILLDTYSYPTKNGQQAKPEEDWTMLRILAEQALDLENQALR